MEEYFLGSRPRGIRMVLHHLLPIQVWHSKVVKGGVVNLKLTIKIGQQVVAEVTGMRVKVNQEDMEKIIEAEQLLERLFGFRFHIQEWR